MSRLYQMRGSKGTEKMAKTLSEWEKFLLLDTFKTIKNLFCDKLLT